MIVQRVRDDDGAYWNDDDELGGWAQFMGERGEDGKTSALKKAKDRRREENERKRAERQSAERRKREGGGGGEPERFDDVGPVAAPIVKKSDPSAKTAYKRGGPRPWEVARQKREAKAEDAAEAAKRYGGSSSADPAESTNAFVRAGLPKHMAEAMRNAGLKRTTEIQRWVIPELVAGEDVVILAETGSGKTFAYTLPMVAAIGSPGRGGTKIQGRCCPAMIVLVPNVELGRQVAYMAELASEWVSTDDFPRPGVFSLLGKDKKLLKPTAPRARGKAKAAAIKRKVQEKAAIRAARLQARKAAEAAAAGLGASPEEVAEAGEEAANLAASKASTEIKQGAMSGFSVKAGEKGSKIKGDMEVIPEFRRAEILVATPARLLSMMQDGWIMPGRLRHVVVDEADEMLSRGFEKEVAAVIQLAYQKDGMNRFGHKVQFCFAAATMREEGPIIESFERFNELRWISTKRFGDVLPQLQQRVERVAGEEHRKERLVAALTAEKQHQAIVFVSNPTEAEATAAHLNDNGFLAMSFHGKTADRGVALDEFFQGHLPVLVCTDLAARGIDFPDLHHVVQYKPAETAEMHLHRCGRTARTGQQGPFIVTCLVDEENDDVDQEVAKLMKLSQRA